jgi:isoleucyl-tRNA synthetase
MTISDEILKRTADSYRRIRNTLRFLLANTNDFNPTKDTVAADDLIALDRWIIAQALELQNELRELFDTFQFHTAVQKIHHFCSEKLGGIYLDIVKDRQYTTQTDSLPRRSCQTAIYLVTEAMTRWITPIMSFTADEVWENMPGEREELGTFTAEWFEGLSSYSHPSIEYGTWDKLILVRAEVTKTLETLRKDGKIGAGLDAEVNILADQTLLDQLLVVEDELRFMLITSDATLSLLDESHASDSITIGEEGSHHKILIQAQASEHAKCIRCWHHRPEVSESEKHPELCGRCIDNIDGSGEKRQYA